MVSAYHDSDSDTESFHSFNDDEPSPPRLPSQTQHNISDSDLPLQPTIERFTPEEEASLLAESNSLKGSANQLFGTGAFDSAIQTYDRALASCPNYLDYEIAVLRSNIAACHLKLEEWKEAVESATKGIECLERLEPLPTLQKRKVKLGGNDNNGGAAQAAEDEEDDEPISSTIEEVSDATALRIANLQKSGQTLDSVRKLQIKLLLRRAKSRTEQGGWSNLQGADEDYHVLLMPVMLPCMSATDRRHAMEAAQKLTPRLEEAKQREMAEMMDKLKGLGNTILKPFGLSTSNFQFVKDEKSGGYSMNFNQNPGKGS